MGYETQLNTDIIQSHTQSNQNGNATVLNQEILPPEKIKAGTMLAGKYRLIGQLNAQSGEADIYTCKYCDELYVAKIYRRASAIKPEIIQKLKQIRSISIARIVDSGTINNQLFEILPYYKNGSLDHKKFSYEQLRAYIIPALLEGLRVLHENDIIHKDLKPANVMMGDDNRHVAIIDFGISSIKPAGSTIVVTQTGMTPQYSAPEAIYGAYMIESDYYSLGITLYELFVGQSPYAGLSSDDIARYIAVQSIPLPDNMPVELRNLIYALTYGDVTHRNDPENPNRRWVYGDVRAWLEGKKYILPGHGKGARIENAEFEYKFLKQTYSSMPDLVIAFAKNWDSGKKELLKGWMYGQLRQLDENAAQLCLTAEDNIRDKHVNPDKAYWDLLYSLDPNSRTFYWQSKVYENLLSLGNDILENLWRNNDSDFAFYDSILKNEILSGYAKRLNTENSMIEGLRALEAFSRTECKTNREKLLLYYQTGYMLSGQKIFNYQGTEYMTIDDLAKHMQRLADNSAQSLMEFCHGLIEFNNNLDAQFEAWLISIGKRSELNRWRETFK